MQIQIYPVSVDPVREMLLADSFVVQNCVPQPLISGLAKAIDGTNVMILQTLQKCFQTTPCLIHKNDLALVSLYLKTPQRRNQPYCLIFIEDTFFSVISLTLSGDTKLVVEFKTFCKEIIDTGLPLRYIRSNHELSVDSHVVNRVKL